MQLYLLIITYTGMNLERPELTAIMNDPMGTMNAMMQEVEKEYQMLMTTVGQF